MNFKVRIKGLFHKHKYTTLLIYPPHNHKCGKEQCKENNNYGFMLRCDCGFHKSAELPSTLTEYFLVESE